MQSSVSRWGGVGLACVLSGPVTTGLDAAGKAKASCPEAERLSLQA